MEGMSTPGAISIVFPVAPEWRAVAVRVAVSVAEMRAVVVLPSAVRRASSQVLALRSKTRYLGRKRRRRRRRRRRVRSITI